MRPVSVGAAAAAIAFLAAASARADELTDRFGAGGYFRLMARPDLQGGTGQLGYWNLYGRLLNEGPYGMLELKLKVLQSSPGTNDAWAEVHARIEGGSFTNADANGGTLNNFRVSQLYVQAGNILLENVTWQLGTLDYWYGDLGLYDMRPAYIFSDAIGLSATYHSGLLDWIVGIGDAGYGIRGASYNAIPTAGTAARLRVGSHLELGLGAQARYELGVTGSKNAPYQTPGVSYDAYLRQDSVYQFVYNSQSCPQPPTPCSLDYPTVANQIIPLPVPVPAVSYKGVGYLGFGKAGPIKWDNLFFEAQRLHPLNFYQESYPPPGLIPGENSIYANVPSGAYKIYVAGLTSHRYELTAGNEMQLTLIPGLLDAVWSTLYGMQRNLSNNAPGSSYTYDGQSWYASGTDNQVYYSTVIRLQLYVTTTVHLLAETSLAREISLNGNFYRDHHDSVFASSSGNANAQGLEFGDSNHRDTWQLKGGIVFNPTGLGIYARPSLRLLYGVQYSSQQAAFGNSFVTSLSQYNQFKTPEIHLHQLIAIEVEAWF